MAHEFYLCRKNVFRRIEGMTVSEILADTKKPENIITGTASVPVIARRRKKKKAKERKQLTELHLSDNRISNELEHEEELEREEPKRQEREEELEREEPKRQEREEELEREEPKRQEREEELEREEPKRQEREEERNLQERDAKRSELLDLLGDRLRDMEVGWERRLDELRVNMERIHQSGVQAMQHKHQREVQEVLKNSQRYDVSSSALGDLVTQALGVCQQLPDTPASQRNVDPSTFGQQGQKRQSASSAEGKEQQQSAPGSVGQLDTRYQSVLSAIRRLQEPFQKCHSLDTPDLSRLSEFKALSESRVTLFAACQRIFKRMQGRKPIAPTAEESQEMDRLVRRRSECLGSVQRALLSLRRCVDETRTLVKAGVVVVNELTDAFALSFPGAQSDEGCASSSDSAGDAFAVYTVPSGAQMRRDITQAFRAYCTARHSLRPPTPSSVTESSVQKHVDAMRVMGSEYRGAVDTLVQVCDKTIATGSRVSEELQRHTRLAIKHLEQRCGEQRARLVKVSQWTGVADRMLCEVQGPVKYLAEMQKLKTATVTDDDVHAYRTMRRKMIKARVSLKNKHNEVSEFETLGEDTSEIRRELKAAEDHFNTLRSDRGFQSFRRAVRRLTLSLPEMRVLFPELAPTALSDVPTVDYGMFHVDADVVMHQGNNTVLRATVTGDECSDVPGLADGAAVVLKEVKLHGSALKTVVKGLSKLQHDAVIPLLAVAEQYDVKQCTTHTSLVFPLYERGDMRQWLREQRQTEWQARRLQGTEHKTRPPSKLTLAERRERAVVAVMRTALDGLRYLHARCVVHCDVKPENILLGADGSGVLCDLDGLRVMAATDGPQGDNESKRATHTPTPQTKRLTLAVTRQQRHEFGTDGYRDPDLQEFSAQSDVYAMGIVLAECLLGWDPVEHGDSHRAHQTLRQAVSRGTGVAKSMDASTRQLLSRMLHADESKRPSVQGVLEHPFFKGRPVLRACMVCGDDEVPVHGGMQCGQGHFVCDQCVQEHVINFADHEAKEWDAPKFKKTKGQVPCCAYKCNCTYTDQQVFNHLLDKDKGWKLLVGARSKVLEGDLNRQIEQQMETRFERKLEEWKRMSEREREVATHRRHIINENINLKCPRCRRVFLDFNGCFALTCSGQGGCDCAFCAWCLKDCGSDAHAHVRSCSHSLNRGDYYGDVNLFDEAHKQRRLREIRQYLGSIDSKIAGEVVVSCLQDWMDIGLEELVQEFE